MARNVQKYLLAVSFTKKFTAYERIDLARYVNAEKIYFIRIVRTVL